MTDSNAVPRTTARGPLLAAAAVLGLLIPFILPLGVLALAITDRRDMRHGRLAPEPPFLHRVAIGVSLIALLGQIGGLVLAGSIWASHTRDLEASGATGVVGDACVAASRCCQAIAGSEDERCLELSERAGQSQSTWVTRTRATEQSVCTQALRSMRGELASAERSIPEVCDFAPPGGARSAK